MASRSDIDRAFQLSGIGRSPSDEEYSYYSSGSFPDAGKVEGDIRHNKDSGGGITNGGGGGSGFTPISAPDLAKIREQAYNLLQPYYEQIAKEAQGDYTRATQILEEDYTKGIREAKQNYAFSQTYGLDTLKNTLATLGLQNLDDQGGLIDKLNERGMAVGQMGPQGQFNALKESPIVPNQGAVVPGQPISFSSSVASPANPQVGYGAYQLSQLQKEQQLRQEAEQRATLKPIEQAGIQFKQYTNLPAGINPNQSPSDLSKALAASGVDRSQLGSSEQSLVRGKEQATRDYQQNTEGLAKQRSEDVNNIASGVANTSAREIPTELQNQYTKELKNNFIATGAT